MTHRYHLPSEVHEIFYINSSFKALGAVKPQLGTHILIILRQIRREKCLMRDTI